MPKIMNRFLQPAPSDPPAGLQTLDRIDAFSYRLKTPIFVPVIFRHKKALFSLIKKIDLARLLFKFISFARDAYDLERAGTALLALHGNLKTPYLINFFQDHGLKVDEAELASEMMIAGFSDEAFSNTDEKVADFNFKKKSGELLEECSDQKRKIVDLPVLFYRAVQHHRGRLHGPRTAQFL